MSVTEIKQIDMTSNGLFGIITVKRGVTRWSLKAVRETSRDVWLETEEEEQLNENCEKKLRKSIRLAEKLRGYSFSSTSLSPISLWGGRAGASVRSARSPASQATRLNSHKKFTPQDVPTGLGHIALHNVIIK